jgi:hypothetical protein
MRSVLIATFTACLGLGSMVWAQAPGQPGPTPGQPPSTPGVQPPIPGAQPPTPGAQPDRPQQSQQAQGEATNLTGCLTKAGSGQYTIVDDKTQKRVTFAAPDKIEPYLNQTVELAGETVTRGASSEFVPQSVKKVAASCQTKPEK